MQNSVNQLIITLTEFRTDEGPPERQLLKIFTRNTSLIDATSSRGEGDELFNPFLGVALGLPKFVQAPSDSVTEFKLPQFYVGESYEADGWMILYVCDSCEGGWTQKIKNTYCPIYVLSYVRTYVLTYALKMWTFVVIFLN